MKVILLEDVKGTGKKGDVKEVSDGYAKNFLLKNKKAVVADSVNMNINSQKKSADAFHEQERVKEFSNVKKELDGKEFVIKVKMGENGKLFGGVTTKEISDKISEDFGKTIEKRQVVLKETIKTVGKYKVEIKLYKNISCNVNILVEKI